MKEEQGVRAEARLVTELVGRAVSTWLWTRLVIESANRQFLTASQALHQALGIPRGHVKTLWGAHSSLIHSPNIEF